VQSTCPLTASSPALNPVAPHSSLSPQSQLSGPKNYVQSLPLVCSLGPGLSGGSYQPATLLSFEAADNMEEEELGAVLLSFPTCCPACRRASTSQPLVGRCVTRPLREEQRRGRCHAMKRARPRGAAAGRGLKRRCHGTRRSLQLADGAVMAETYRLMWSMALQGKRRVNDRGQ
jgi:hypothetical protein